ncbi:hypothetical protein Tco_0589546, partial [Tanacetum coccineum]
EQSDHRMAESLRVRNTVRNLGPLMRDEEEMEIEMEEMKMVMETEENMAITSEDLCLLESAHIKTF